MDTFNGDDDDADDDAAAADDTVMMVFGCCCFDGEAVVTSEDGCDCNWCSTGWMYGGGWSCEVVVVVGVGAGVAVVKITGGGSVANGAGKLYTHGSIAYVDLS